MLITLNFHDVHRVDKLQFLEKSTTHFNWLVYEIDLENTPSPSLWNLSKNSTASPPHPSYKTSAFITYGRVQVDNFST